MKGIHFTERSRSFRRPKERSKSAEPFGRVSMTQSPEDAMATQTDSQPRVGVEPQQPPATVTVQRFNTRDRHYQNISDDDDDDGDKQQVRPQSKQLKNQNSHDSAAPNAPDFHPRRGRDFSSKSSQDSTTRLNSTSSSSSDTWHRQSRSMEKDRRYKNLPPYDDNVVMVNSSSASSKHRSTSSGTPRQPVDARAATARQASRSGDGKNNAGSKREKQSPSQNGRLPSQNSRTGSTVKSEAKIELELRQPTQSDLNIKLSSPTPSASQSAC